MSRYVVELSEEQAERIGAAAKKIMDILHEGTINPAEGYIVIERVRHHIRKSYEIDWSVGSPEETREIKAEEIRANWTSTNGGKRNGRR